MRRPNVYLFIGFVVLISVATRAAHFTTAVQQGTSANWLQPIWQPGPVSPTAGNTYECVAGGNPTRIRPPASGSGDPVVGVKTFPGNSLQLNAATEIRCKGFSGTTGNIMDFPGVGGNPGLILNGGTLDHGDNGPIYGVTGVVLVQADSSITCGDSQADNTRGWLVGAEIRGGANIAITKNFADGSPAVELTATNSPFTGNWIVNGGIFKATGSNSLGSGGVTLNPGVAGSVFEPMYDVVSAGALVISSGNTIMRLHQNCRYASLMIDELSLDPGDYDAALLISLYPAHFPADSSGMITVGPPPAPQPPANVTAASGDAIVNLSWSSSFLATGYNIYRSIVSGSGYAVLGTTGNTTFQDTTVVNGLTYYYVITATNITGESANSVEVVGRPSVVVTGLTAVGGTNQITLAWDAYTGATSYNVKRADNTGGPYTAIASSVSGTSYVDTTAQPGRTYFYVVTANLLVGETLNSAEAFALTAPPAPTVTVTMFGTNALRIGIVTSNTAITQYSIEVSPDGTTFSPLGTIAGNVSHVIVSNLTAHITNYARVQGQNATGFSPYSTVASGTTAPEGSVSVNFAAGPLNSAGNPVAPVPPGYAQDIGLPYGDQGNGFFYGWYRDGNPVDIQADGRYRQNAAAPDLRYDTFMHLIKAVPPAYWEIMVPNGDYCVHIVAGDPNNPDSVFQFDVEGVLTPTVTPNGPGSVFGLFADFTVGAAVADGLLTIRSGPDSQTLENNNKIAFVDIYPATRPTLSITKIAEGTRLQFATENGCSYVVEYQDVLDATAPWIALQSVVGNGAVQTVVDPGTSPTRFYRIRLGMP
jgi:hypothetical protein